MITSTLPPKAKQGYILRELRTAHIREPLPHCLIDSICSLLSRQRIVRVPAVRRCLHEHALYLVVVCLHHMTEGVTLFLPLVCSSHE